MRDKQEMQIQEHGVPYKVEDAPNGVVKNTGRAPGAHLSLPEMPPPDSVLEPGRRPCLSSKTTGERPFLLSTTPTDRIQRKVFRCN